MSSTRTQIIVPTAINVLTLINDSVIAARKANDPVDIALPSIRKRARLIVNGEGTLQVTTSSPTADPKDYTR
jgi:hypothetical protein